MFRATRLLALLLALAALFALSNVRAESMKVLNLIGMVDYSSKPDFKIGSWVRYSNDETSADGTSNRFRTMILIAGEERFWGDDGFWVETWTELQPGVPSATGTLMSYAIFQDSFPYSRMQHYMRKTSAGMDEETGKYAEEVVARSLASVRVRKWLSSREMWKTDTLGPDTVTTPAGTFHCIKVKLERGTGKTEDIRDSTIYSETRETRYEYLTREVPITHLVREDIQWTSRRRSWRIGQFQEGAPYQLLQQSWMSSRLVDKGTGDYPSMILGDARRKSLREQFPAEFAPKRAAAKPGGSASRR